MRRFAFVNDNKVQKTEEHESFDNILDSHLFQIVIDVTDYSRAPQVGWAWERGRLIFKLPDVTPRQIRQAMILAGVSMAQIEAAIDAMPEPNRTLAKIEWEYSTAFIRANPLVAGVGMMLGWTEEQLDALWITAGRL